MNKKSLQLASIIICHVGLLISKPIMNTSLLSHFSSLAVSVLPLEDCSTKECHCG